MNKICPHCGTKVELILDKNCEPDVYHCEICQTDTPANLWMKFYDKKLSQALKTLQEYYFDFDIDDMYNIK